jgi:hypothetical protein
MAIGTSVFTFACRSTLHDRLLTFLQHMGIVGEGGNGRAVLYCKIDATGNIIQVSSPRTCAMCNMMGLVTRDFAVTCAGRLSGPPQGHITETIGGGHVTSSLLERTFNKIYC